MKQTTVKPTEATEDKTVATTELATPIKKAKKTKAKDGTKKAKKAKVKEPKTSLDKVNKDNLEAGAKEPEKMLKGEASLLELKYLYPDDITSPYERKKYRAKIRRQAASLDKKYSDLDLKELTPERKAEKEALRLELIAFRAKHYTAAQNA